LLRAFELLRALGLGGWRSGEELLDNLVDHIENGDGLLQLSLFWSIFWNVSALVSLLYRKKKIQWSFSEVQLSLFLEWVLKSVYLLYKLTRIGLFIICACVERCDRLVVLRLCMYV
jgi:hypothetical protein